ncbi:MAG: low specificity L-threonine aldolase [Verrucomicrobiota bacterium]|nr:low specificity L-threonine aldolase [Verrucomicrobiota bacterium]
MSNTPNAHTGSFASDNWAGICPEAWAALGEANDQHAPSYGEDAWTGEAARLLRELFETDCEVFFLFAGTAANSLALASLCPPFASVLCHEVAHIATDECGAPGFFAHGTTLLPLAGVHGKVTPASIDSAVKRRRDIHAPLPRALSLTQATELGTVYTPAEIAAVSTVARDHGLRVYMDGARFANALATLQVAPRRLSWEAGIDVLTFGGTKNGLALGEALIFFDRDLARFFEYRRKQGGQLASKMRFLSAQWTGVLRDGAWLRNAAHANAMAARLEQGLASLQGTRILYPREANAVFAAMPEPVINGLHARDWHFYTDVGPDGAARLMCSWDTTIEAVDAFLGDAADLSK